jgi:hypothetical protein
MLTVDFLALFSGLFGATRTLLLSLCGLQSASPGVIATFSTPEVVRVNPTSMLWLLPLAASVAVVYKATKLPTITAANFIKEVAVLFGSIVVFIIISALVLYALAWLVVE